MERRRKSRKPGFVTQPELSVLLGSERFTARLINSNEDGFGLETSRPIAVGCRLHLKGELAHGTTMRMFEADGLVRWSTAAPNGRFHCGVLIDHSGAPPSVSASEPDFYEVLQLSPNADPDTVHRVFRVLAQRFHPDNRETGDETFFKAVVRAYEVLSDPTRRAGYDADRPGLQQRRWRIFESSEAARGIEAERRKRHGILSALYVRRVNDPREPNMTLFDLEQLLGCPREHLEFTLWFLKENAWITRGDNGRYSITAKGVEKAESLGDYPLGENRMIAAPSA